MASSIPTEYKWFFSTDLFDSYRTLTGTTTTLSQSGTGNNDNEEVTTNYTELQKCSFTIRFSLVL